MGGKPVVTVEYFLSDLAIFVLAVLKLRLGFLVVYIPENATGLG